MSNYKKTLTITTIISFFLIILIISAGSSPVLDNSDNRDNDSILLKNARIDTSSVQQSKAAQNIAISQNQVDERYYLVQFKGYTKEEWKQALRASGAVLYDYVPNNAFITMMNSSVKSQVEALDSVNWVGIYEPGYRISPALSSSASIMGQGSVNENITVLLFDARDNMRISDEITGLGGEIISNSGDRIRVSIAKTKIPDAAQINGVSWMEKYVQPVLMNDVAANITTAYSVRNTHGLTGAGQIVAVADTGLDTGINNTTMHDDIEGRIVALIDLSGNGAADTFSGHGTHVAGSVLGNGARSGGQFKGMAPGASLVFQAAEDSNGYLTGFPLDLNDLFQQAYDQGARIHSNSWGYKYFNGVYYTDSKDTDNFVWNNPDMLILFAVGNEGIDGNSNGVIDQDSITPPATAKNALSIGASENNRQSISDIYSSFLFNGNIKFPSEPIYSDKLADNIEGLAAFSGRGPTDDGRIKPDVAAPGTFILSLRSSAAPAGGLWGDNDTYYRYSGGTSMSTPVVAGIAALARQYYVQNESIAPSAALLKATIINGAHNMTPGQYGTGATQEIQTRPDYAQGWGRVDLENSLFPALPRIMRYYDNSTGLSFTQSWNTSYYVENSSEPFRVTLVWSDYPGVPSAVITLVNNLDLTVTGPNGTYYGNGAPDNRNNVEQVELVFPSLGLYTIRVNGTNIPQGPQPFAVVISGALDFLPPSASNEFPTNNSYTNNSTTNAAVNITDTVSGVNLSSIDMMINGSYVSFSNTPISNGYSIQNVTTVPYSDGRVNVSVNATNNDSKSLIYSWSFIVDTKAPYVTINPVSYQRANAAKTGSTIELNVSANDPVVNSISSGLKNASVNVSLINNTGIITLTNNSGFWKGNVTLDRPADDGNYSLKVSFSDNVSNINSSEYINVTIDNTPPSVTNISVSSVFVNATNPVNITANITSDDLRSEVNTSEVFSRLKYPNGTSINYPMNPGGGSLFYYNFTDTIQYGRFNITIVANDTTGNTNSTQIKQFATVLMTVNTSVETNANNDTMVYAPGSNTTLRLFTNNTSLGAINITQSRVNISSLELNITNPGIYVLVNASQDIRNNLTYVVLSVNYTDADVSSFVESSLRLYRWNTTSSAWEKLSGPGSPSFVNDAGVDTVNNFVWANLTNLSEFAIGGSLYTPPSQQITSSGGGGGGGGGGKSGENTSNIELIEKYDLQISKDALTAYRFTDKRNPLMYVNITGNTTLGIITASVEVLKGTSTLVSFPPEGLVYKNANIWVGTAGFATPKNIKDALIKFRVANSWMSENSVQNSDMVLEKWDASKWIQLGTEFVSKDDTYSYFEGRTNSFSPFAIVAKAEAEAKITSPTTSDSGTAISPGATGTAPVKAPIPGFPSWIIAVIVIVIIAAAVYFLARKKR